MPATGSKTHIPQNLSIRLRADGFCFFVCNPHDSSLVRCERFDVGADEDMGERLQTELGRPEYFNHNIDQVFVLSTENITHIPLEEFRRESSEAMYELTFNHPDMEKIHVSYNILPHLETVELYSIPREVEHAILQYYPTARFFGAHAMLMERLLRLDNEKTDGIRLFFIYPDGDNLTVFHFDNGRLRMSNTFTAHNAPDALYFILYAWKTLGLDAERDHCLLLGQTQWLKELPNYVANIIRINPSMLFPNIPLTKEKDVPLDTAALLLNRL